MCLLITISVSEALVEVFSKTFLHSRNWKFDNWRNCQNPLLSRFPTYHYTHTHLHKSVQCHSPSLANTNTHSTSIYTQIYKLCDPSEVHENPKTQLASWINASMVTDVKGVIIRLPDSFCEWNEDWFASPNLTKPVQVDESTSRTDHLSPV